MNKWQCKFFEAVDLNNLDRMKEVLRHHEVNINAKGDNAQTALIFAAECGFMSIVEELINAKADLNLEDLDGKTALIHSVERGSLDITLKLIEAGADVLKKDKEGIDAYNYAMREGDLEMAMLIQEAVRKHLKENSNQKITAHSKGPNISLLMFQKERD